jgi:hypothetical protein
MSSQRAILLRVLFCVALSPLLTVLLRALGGG